MCYEPDFELPGTFIHTAQSLERSLKAREIPVKLTQESAVLIEKISEQTGLTESAVSSGLLAEGLAHFLMKGILF